jgi:hypothetical protein
MSLLESNELYQKAVNNIIKAYRRNLPDLPMSEEEKPEAEEVYAISKIIDDCSYNTRGEGILGIIPYINGELDCKQISFKEIFRTAMEKAVFPHNGRFKDKVYEVFEECQIDFFTRLIALKEPNPDSVAYMRKFIADDLPLVSDAFGHICARFRAQLNNNPDFYMAGILDYILRNTRKGKGLYVESDPKSHSLLVPKALFELMDRLKIEEQEQGSHSLMEVRDAINRKPEVDVN